MAPQLDSYFKQVDSLSDAFIERLRKAVAIPSISADEERRQDVVRVSVLSGSPLTFSLQTDGRVPRVGAAEARSRGRAKTTW